MRWTEEDLQKYRLKGAHAMHLAQSGRPGPRPNKFGNVKVIDASGAVHDSKKEYRRWCELKLREHAGDISGLRRQVVFDLIVNNMLVCKYIADAVYVECATGEQITEDTKSPPTRKKPDYRIKVKLMKAIHGIEIREA